MLCTLTYDRVNRAKREEIIRTYKTGRPPAHLNLTIPMRPLTSMARLALVFGTSATEILNIIRQSQTAGNPVYECNRLTVTLHKNDLDAKGYLDLIRADNVMARHGISSKETLLQVKKFTDSCYKYEIDMRVLAFFINKFQKFVSSAPRDELPSTIINQLKLYSDACRIIDARASRMGWLRDRIEVLKQQLKQKENKNCDLFQQKS
jgi:hypothetical protein